jgi:hypothetical protein
VNAAREHGLPKGFTNLRALQQPKRSEHPGVNWDKHCKRQGRTLAHFIILT